MIHAVRIAPDGTATALHRQLNLADKQSMVGGLIEYVELRDGQAVINEEGKIHRLELNPLATALWYDHLGRVVSDVLVGPVVIIGPDDGQGNDTPITETMLSRLRECDLTFT